MNAADRALLERDRELDAAIKTAEKELCKTREYLQSDGFKQFPILEEGIKFEVIKLKAGIDIPKEEIKNYTILPPKDVQVEGEDYAVDCKNKDCPWSGLASECIYYDAEYYCPKCGEFVEPVSEPY